MVNKGGPCLIRVHAPVSHHAEVRNRNKYSYKNNQNSCHKLSLNIVFNTTLQDPTGILVSLMRPDIKTAIYNAFSNNKSSLIKSILKSFMIIRDCMYRVHVCY